MKKTTLLLSLTLVICLIAYLSHDFLFAKKANLTKQGETLYQTNCALCHNAGLGEAPRLEALQLLSKEAILTSLQTGVMRNQGALLSVEEQEAVALFVSKVDASKISGETTPGMCEESSAATAKIRVSNWGLDLSNTRFVNEEALKINAENVSRLALDWVFPFPQASRARCQPTIAGNTLYTADQHGLIYALDRHTGCIRWTYKAENEVRSAISIGTDKDGNAQTLYFGDFKANVYALEIATRKLIWKVQVDDHPDATITGSLNLYQGHLYVPVSSTEIIAARDSTYACCTFRGSVVALDASNGRQIWKTYTSADKPAPKGKTRAGTAIMAPSGAPVWSSPTIDSKRQVLYVGTGENYSRPTSEGSDAIIAMSLADGRIQWIRQTIARDAWNAACVGEDGPNCPENHGPDADFGAPPVLVSRKGKGDLILAGQKSGMVFAMDPDNQGKIIWQERVGRGAYMGGVHWGMATDGHTLYVPINDEGVHPLNDTTPIAPGLHAVNLDDGERIWSVIEEDRCRDAKWACGPGISAAITASPELIFAGAFDGVFKIYSATDGKELWAFNTNREFGIINGIKAFGGTIDSDGPVVIDDQVFLTSGYAKFGEKAGNVLLAFKLAPAQ